jgi:hypothetical protein
LSGQDLGLKFIELDKIPQKAQSAILWNENTERKHLPILQLIRNVINL